MEQQAIPMGLIKTCFQSEYYPALFSGDETNNPALRFVGQIIPYTQDKVFIKLLVNSGLPENYSSNTLRELDGMIDGAIKKGFHERPIKEDDKSGTASSKLLDAIDELGGSISFFHDSCQIPYISIQKDNMGISNYPLRSQSAALSLKYLFYKKYGFAIHGQGFKDAMGPLEARALFDSPMEETFLRVARDDSDAIILNLSDDEGYIVRIDDKNYERTQSPPVIFVNSPTMSVIPKPVRNDNFHLDNFRDLLGVEQETFIRILAFIINCYNPNGPYLFLLVQGEQGSGKSLLCHLIKMLVDPSNITKMRMPKSTHDLMIMANDMLLMVFDNVSGIKAELSDALCTLSTGGGMAIRMLYTNDELKVFNATRPFILNGITGVANRPDLLERCISINLPSMPEDKILTEVEILSKFEEMRPFILDKLLQSISHGLNCYDDIETPKSIRMADAAKWVISCEQGLGFEEGTFLKTLQDSHTEIYADVLETNALAVAIINLVEEQPFEGLIGTLFKELNTDDSNQDRYFPKTSAHLSREITRMKLALKKVGVCIEFIEKNREGRPIRIWMEDQGTFEEAFERQKNKIPM